jgi:hypothetical protein
MKNNTLLILILLMCSTSLAKNIKQSTNVEILNQNNIIDSKNNLNSSTSTASTTSNNSIINIFFIIY